MQDAQPGMKERVTRTRLVTFQCPKEMHSSALTWSAMSSVIQEEPYLEYFTVLGSTYLYHIVREMKSGGWLRATGTRCYEYATSGLCAPEKESRRRPWTVLVQFTLA